MRCGRKQHSLDGTLIGSAPLTKKQLESGRHFIQIKAELYHPFEQEIEITDGGDTTMHVILKPAFGTLEVSSSPEDSAELFLDGKRVGSTPYKDTKLSSGRYLLKVVKEFYNSDEGEITISDGATTTRQLQLTKNFAELIVFAPKSDIFVDGEKKGTDKLKLRLLPGNYKLRAERQGPYTPAEQDIFLRIGESVTHKLEPEGKYGNLFIKIEPFDAGDAEIFLNGISIGNAPLAIKQLVGEYELKSRKKGFLDMRQMVTIKEEETLRLDLVMNKSSEKFSPSEVEENSARAESTIISNPKITRNNLVKNYGIKGALTLANQNFESNNLFNSGIMRIGFNAGVFIEWSSSASFFTFITQIEYVQKGRGDFINMSGAEAKETSFRLDYLSIPLMCKLSLPSFPYFLLGPRPD
ncbi:MAG: PEGA domain-containing protein, partial [Ignavibacteriae bacterium]|nr:PEGA domain-containing protein [Ignavibacteriota bacterium]